MKHFLALLLFFQFFLLHAQNEGANFHAYQNIHEIRLTFHQNAYWDSLIDSYAGDFYIKADIEIDGILLADCGVKMKGNSSYNSTSVKKSFKLDFNEFVNAQNYDGLKKLNLNNAFKDPTLLREKLMFDFLNANGCYAPRAHFANVYINDQLWGLYTTVEEIDKTFLSNAFQDDKGNLFKGDPSGDLKWLGAQQSLYEPKYELKLNESLNDWTDLITFINTLNNTPGNLHEALNPIFDSENFIKTWAAHNLFANLDSYIGSGHNYYLYHDSLTSQFKFISWDANEAFGNFNMGMSVSQLEQMNMNYFSPPSGNRPLIEKLMADSTYYAMYENVICTYLDFNFSPAGLYHRIDSLANLIRPSVYADPNKFFTNQQFEDNLSNTINVPGTPGGENIAGLKSFINNRRNAVATQIADYCILGIDELKSSPKFSVYPNPSSNEVTIETPGNSNNSFVICDLQGKLLKSLSTSSNIFKVNVSDLANGVYFVQETNSSDKGKMLIIAH
jgi:spore coat protein CotH